MQVEFYLRDEEHRAVDGSIVKHEGVLYLKQPKSGFDNKATKDHVKAYPGQFQEFLTANPGYVLPDSFKEAQIGDPTNTVVEPKMAADGELSE